MGAEKRRSCRTSTKDLLTFLAPSLPRQRNRNRERAELREDELDEIHRRLEIIAKRQGIAVTRLTDLHIVDMTDETETAIVVPQAKHRRLALTTVHKRLVATLEVLRPKLVVIDTRTDAYDGDEMDRGQVRFFIRALRRICFKYDMAILLISHPSVAGLTTGTGQSGSTAWGNSVRSRLYFERPKVHAGMAADSGLRILTTKKSDYGPADSTITLRWDAGIFRPDGTGATTIDRVARDRSIETRFLELQRDFDRQGRHVNANSGPDHAPKQFAAVHPGAIGHQQFKAAMDRLFAAGKLRVEPYGAPSRNTKKIVEVTS